MRILTQLILCSLLTVSPLLAGAGSDEPSRIGFFSTKSDSIPSLVKTAAQSVLKIQVPAIVFDLSNSAHREKLEKFSANLDTIIPTEDERIRVRPQLVSCKKSKDFCVIWVSGSAIALQDGTVLTALHNVSYVIQKSLADQALWEDAYKVEFPVRLIDSAGQILTGEGSLGKTKAKIKKIDKLLGQKPIQENYETSADFVVLELSQPLKISGAKISAGKNQHQELVFLVGFPVETSGRSALGGLDSDGKSQYVSFGPSVVQSVNDVAFRGDCASGMSGGALFDQAGFLLGVFTRNNIQDINRNPSVQNRCAGVGVETIFLNR